MARLESSWRSGEFRSVREILESYPPAAVAGEPIALWLLASCRFDEGDLEGARGFLNQLESRGWRPALVAALRARIEAAAGHAGEAEQALAHAVASGLPSADAAALGLVVSLSLCRFDRLSEQVRAAAEIPRGQTRVRRLLDNVRVLAANLVSLEKHQPELVRRIVAARPWDYFFVVDQQGTPTPALRTGRGQEIQFLAAEQHTREAEALNGCAAQLRMTTPVLLVGLGTGAVVAELAKVPPLHGKRLGIVAVPTRLEELAGLLLVHDWSELLAERAIHFLDADAASLESYLRADLRRVPLGYRYTTCVVAPEPFGSEWLRGAARVLQELRAELDEQVHATAEHYGSAEFAERWRRHAAAGGLRIMLQTCRYTTFVYHNSRHLAQAFCDAGHDVVLLEEGDEPQQWIGPAYVQAQIAERRPDLYLRTNFLRQETDAVIPTGLPFLTWIQDYCPAHFEPGRAGRLLPRDYLTGISKYPLLGHGFPAQRYLPNVAPSLAAVYRAPTVGGRAYRYDVSYVSHQSTPPAAWVRRFGRTRRPPAELRWVIALAAELDRAAREGRVLYDVFTQLGGDFVNSLVPRPWPPWVYHHALQLTNLHFRQSVLAWIAEAGYELALFGNGWEEHPTLGRYARGPVANGAELKECYRASRVHLQLMATGNLHQRLIDGYLAGAFFLMPIDTDPPPALPVGNPALHERLVEALTAEAITTVKELRGAHPELADYLCSLPPAGSDGSLAFAAAENDLLNRTELRIPFATAAMFRDRDDLLARLDYWIRRDAEREAFVARIADSGCLESFTAEFQVRRVLKWLAHRIAECDPPIVLPPLIRDDERPIAASGPVVEGRADGTWTLRGPGGDLVAEGIYRAGQCYGTWKIYSGGVCRAVGMLRESKKEGRWEFFNAAGRRERIATYCGDVLHGPYQQFAGDGTLEAEGSYDTGQQSGQWTFYSRAGWRFATGELRNGKKTGPWIQWHPNGQPARTGTFVDGKRQGSAIAYHANGAVWARGQLEEDQRHGRYERFYADGALRAVRNYRRGAPEGEWTFYYRNGKRKWQIGFHEGKPNGIWASWYSDGRQRGTGEWSHGVRCGEWVRWDRSGAVIQRISCDPANGSVAG